MTGGRPGSGGIGALRAERYCGLAGRPLPGISPAPGTGQSGGRKRPRTVARLLTGFGFEVREKIGTTGVVGILKNGDGPTVLVRADMDALPMAEETGLPYASTDTATDDAGNTVPVAHACGHDVHVASLLGAARLLAAEPNGLERHFRHTLPAGRGAGRWGAPDGRERAGRLDSEAGRCPGSACARVSLRAGRNAQWGDSCPARTA